MRMNINDIVQLKTSNIKMKIVEIKGNKAKCMYLDSKKNIKEYDLNLLIVSDINSLMPSLIIDENII